MKKVLLVDDEEFIIEVVEQFLVHAGFKVKSLENGRDVKSVLENEHFDALITDIVLPFVSGIKIIREARQKFKDLSIIAKTGGARVELEYQDHEAFEAGADMVIYKPFSGFELVKKLNELLEKANEK